MFDKVLISNRGAIARRIARTLRRMRVRSVAVYSDADRNSLHVTEADEAVCIGPAQAARSYLDRERIFDAVRKTGAQAIHPGYGFLSENVVFAVDCHERGVVFIGPKPVQMELFARKHAAREIAARLGVPLLPGTGLLANAGDAAREAARIGYPVIVKSTAGGGGIGMRVCRSATEVREAFEAVQRLSETNFGEGGVFIERFVAAARHVEVQIFGDGRGKVIALGERDCSTQRRHQKVIEETPAPGIAEGSRQRLFQAAIALGEAARYESAGTVEFVYDESTSEFYFLEVNTRLQVEHGVTEEVTGIDLVEWMVRQAAGCLPPLASLAVHPSGCSMEARIYAEDPARDFRPSSGRLM